MQFVEEETDGLFVAAITGRVIARHLCVRAGSRACVHVRLRTVYSQAVNIKGLLKGRPVYREGAEPLNRKGLVY